MKYKVLKGTALYQKFQDFDEKRRSLDKKATALAKKIGEDFGENTKGAHLGHGGDVISGGIVGICLATQPANWRKAMPQHYDGFYYPKKLKVNADLLAQIEALPVMKQKEANDIIGFKEQFGQLKYFFGYGMQWGKDCVLIEVNNEAEFTPVADMIEILESEFITLSKTKP